MKILYISKSIIPSRSANSIHVMKMCHAFADNGHEVVLLAPDIKNRYEKDIKNIYDYYGVKKNFLIKKLWNPDYKFGTVIYILNIFFFLLTNKKFDLIFGRFIHGCYIATLLKKKVIFETHEIIFKKKNFNYLIFKYLIKNKYLQKIIVISNSLKNIYLKNKYLNKSMILVAHDGADKVKNFSSKTKLLGCVEKLKVGYVGHLYKGRGIQTIFKCAKEINDMTFHVVGGLKEDIKYWQSYLENSGLKNIFFYGHVSPKKAFLYRNSFDIVLAPYEKKVSIEGGGDTSKFMSPIKIFEYMSHKKAIIASDLPVIREVLNDSNSILVKCDDVKSWIKALHKLKDLKYRKFISNKALNDFYRFSWKNRASLIVKNFNN